MPFILRFNTTMNGGMTFTGNTLGLNKVTNQNNQGNTGSIGAFSTLNTSVRVGNFPLGTTLDYTQNASTAILDLPSGSTVQYAELIWAASYNTGGNNVIGQIGNPVLFTTPAGTFSVAPDPATARNTAPTANDYVNSANVTALVQQGGAGTYITGAVPGTVTASNNNDNFAGWTLAVVYENPFLPSRNMSVFVGAEVVNQALGTATATITGFATPVTGVVSGRLMVSAGEGDPQLLGDQLRFGPTAATLVAISGPNNPVSNFFGSQINNNLGLLDTRGTFGSLNSTPGNAVIGARQGWDITNVDVSSRLVNSQTSAVIQATSQGDAYLVNALGLQVDVNAPFFVFNKSSNVSSALVGDVVQYTLTAANTGTASANLVLLQDTFPASGVFVPGSFSVNGVVQPGADPTVGVNLGTVAPGRTLTIIYSVQIVSRPPGSAQTNVANLNYNYQSLPGGPTFQGMSQSNGNSIAIGNRPPTTQSYSLVTNENIPVGGQVTGTDPDGDALTFSLNSVPTSGTAIVNPDGTYQYTPNTGFVGNDSFTVLVSDGFGGTAVSTIAITVLNQPPIANNLDVSTTKNAPATGQVTATDPNGDVLTFSLNSSPANGTVVLNPDGTFQYNPNPSFAGNDSFTYLVSDPNGGTAIGIVTVHVLNQPPVAQNLNLITPENLFITGQVIATDPDGDSLTFTLNASPVNGTVVVNADGTFQYNPNPGFIGTDTFTVLVTDPSGGTAISTVTIQVINLPPVTSNLSVATTLGVPAGGQVVATDPNGDPLTFTLQTAPSNGTAVVNPDGTFTYTPNPGFIGVDNFNVLVSDPNGGTAVSVVTVTVINQPPIVQNLSLSTLGNTPAGGQVIATDPDGNPLTFSLNSPPLNGTVALNPDGTFTYTPNPGFAGVDSFTVLVSDGFGGTAIGTVTVSVQNLPPVTSDVLLSTLQNLPAGGQVVATDPNGDPLTFSLLSIPANGSAVVNPDGTFTYTPNTGYVGPDSFTVLVSDGLGGTAISTVFITVIDQPPIGQTQNFSTLQNTPLPGQLLATDPDGDPLTFTLQSPPANGTAVVNPDGTFTYTPAVGFVGTDSFTALISDGKGGTAIGTAIITVIDQPPVAQDLTLTTNVNTPVAGQIPATDPDGDTLTYTLSVPPANGTVVLNPDGSFTYTPNLNFVGTDTFSVLVSDGKGGTATSNVTIGVPVDGPVTSDVTLNTTTDVPVGGQVIATDPQGQTLTYAVLVPPANGTVLLNPADGTFTYSPNVGFIGTDTFTVRVTNTSGVFSDSLVTVNVSNIPPIAGNLTLDTFQNTPVAGQIPASDPDGNPLNYTLSVPPSLGSVLLNPADGTFTYTPNAGVVGLDTFSVLVDDGRGGTATSVVTVNILDRPPVTQDVSLSTPNSTPVAGAVTATDPDGDPLTFSLNAAPVFGTAVVNLDGTFTYTPNSGYVGPDSFTVLVDDGKGGTAISTVSISVTNAPPVATGTSVTTPQNTPVNGAVTAVDPEGNLLTFSQLSSPVNGTVVVNTDGTFTYFPNTGYLGPDSFTVLVSDGLGGTAIASVDVTVTNNPPVTSDLSLSTNINTPVSGQVTATDPDGDALTFSILSLAANGIAEVNPDGTFIYTPNTGYSGIDSFTVLVSDGKGGNAVSTVTIQVVNRPPVVSNTTYGTVQPAPVSGVVTASDPDGDPLSYVVDTPPVSGTVLLNPDGTFTYTPNPAFFGTDFFTVMVNDGRGGITFGVITIDVAINPPVVQDLSISTGGNIPVSSQVTVTDPNGLPVTVTILSPPLNGTVIVNPDGTFTYTPNTGFIGTDSFTVQAVNSAGGSGVGTVTVTVLNLPPTADGASLATIQNTPVSGAVTASDPDGNPLTFTLNSTPSSGTVILNADGSFTYTPNTGFVGADSFTVLVSDGLGGTAIALVTITVTGRPPITQDQSIETGPNTSVDGQIIASDPDGDPLTYVIGSFPTNGTVVLNADGSFTYTPNTGFVGTDSFTVWVLDGTGGSAVSTVSITIPNLPPIVSDFATSTLVGTPVTSQIPAVDPEGNPLTYALGTAPLSGTVIVNPDGTFTYTPDVAFIGTDTFTVVVTDPFGASTTGRVTITVFSAPPVAPDIFLTTPINTPVSGVVLASDPQASTLIYTQYVPLPSNGTVVVNADGTFTYTPNPGFTGVDTFPIIVSDLYGENAISRVTIVVGEDVPIATPVNVGTAAGQPVTGFVPAEDPAGLPLTFTLGNPPTNGTAVVGPDGTFTYTPNPGFTGTDTFSVIVTNSAGISAVAPVTIIVGGNSPVASPVNVRTTEGQPVSGRVIANDPNGLALTFSLGIPPTNGMVVVNPDGTFTYTPNPGFVGTDTFTVIVTNSAGLFAVAFATVTVFQGSSPFTAGPITTDIGIGTNQGQPVTGQILASSPAGLALTYMILQSQANGSLELNPDGSFIYTPNPGFNGTDTFSVTVTDSQGRTAVSTVTVVVYPPANTGGETTIRVQLTTPRGRPVSGAADGGPGAVYQVYTQPENGNLRLRSDGTYTYTPNPGFIGSDTFTIRYTDSRGAVYLYVVTVNVVALSNTVLIDLRTEENTSVSGDLNSFGRLSTAQLVDAPNNGRVTLNANGTFTYIPDLDYIGPDQITFIVTLASGETYTVIVNIRVVPGGEE